MTDSIRHGMLDVRLSLYPRDFSKTQICLVASVNSGIELGWFIAVLFLMFSIGFRSGALLGQERTRTLTSPGVPCDLERFYSWMFRSMFVFNYLNDQEVMSLIVMSFFLFYF